MTDQNSFCAIGCHYSSVACFQWELNYCTCRRRLAGPPRCDVVIFVLLQLTVLICLLSICASETNSLRDSRCFSVVLPGTDFVAQMLLFNTCIHTYIQTDIHTFIHTYMHTYMHACIHACTTYSYRSIRGCYCERAGAVWGDLMLLDWCVQYCLSSWKSITRILNLPHTTCSAPILHHFFSLSCFPHAIFTFLLLLVGRSWHVGLSGPLIDTRMFYMSGFW